MSSSSEITKKALRAMSALQNLESLLEDIKNKTENNPVFEGLPGEVPVSNDGVKRRLEFLSQKAKKDLPFLTGKKQFSN